MTFRNSASDSNTPVKFASLSVSKGAIQALKQQVENILASLTEMISNPQYNFKILIYLMELKDHFTRMKPMLFGEKGEASPSEEDLKIFFDDTNKLKKKSPPPLERAQSGGRSLFGTRRDLVASLPTSPAAMGLLYIVLKEDKSEHSYDEEDLSDAEKMLEKGDVIYCSGSMPDRKIAEGNILIALRIPPDFDKRSSFSVNDIERIRRVTSGSYLKDFCETNSSLPAFDIKKFDILKAKSSEIVPLLNEINGIKIQVEEDELAFRLFGEFREQKKAVIPPTTGNSPSPVGVKLGNLFIYYTPGALEFTEWGIFFIDYEQEALIPVSCKKPNDNAYFSLRDVWPVVPDAYCSYARSGRTECSPEQIAHLRRIRSVLIKAGLTGEVTLQELQAALTQGGFSQKPSPHSELDREQKSLIKEIAAQCLALYKENNFSVVKIRNLLIEKGVQEKSPDFIHQIAKAFKLILRRHIEQDSNLRKKIANKIEYVNHSSAVIYDAYYLLKPEHSAEKILVDDYEKRKADFVFLYGRIPEKLTILLVELNELITKIKESTYGDLMLRDNKILVLRELQSFLLKAPADDLRETVRNFKDLQNDIGILGKTNYQLLSQQRRDGRLSIFNPSKTDSQKFIDQYLEDKPAAGKRAAVAAMG